MNNKRCVRCQQDLPEEDFLNDSHSHCCKECYRQAVLTYKSWLSRLTKEQDARSKKKYLCSICRLWTKGDDMEPSVDEPKNCKACNREAVKRMWPEYDED